jgi:nickel/cobalt exporter
MNRRVLLAMILGAGALAAQPRSDYLSRLLHEGEIGWGMMLAGLVVAFALGALHALSPGHGKTIVAAYLVGTRGTPRHAIFLGGMVTFTHSVSVFLLGLATLCLSRFVLPERIYPVLGAISGIAIVAIGSALFWRRFKALRHAQAHRHHHDHHSHDHPHGHVPDEVSMTGLIALGASGGLVPCPSALVLLLSSVALGRVGLGLILLVAFSAGLAVVLSGIGLAVLYAKHLLPDTEKASGHAAFRYLPVASAAVITVVGVVMTAVAVGV